MASSLPLLPGTPLRRREMPFSSKVQEETVMMSLETNCYYGLGLVGSRIWELLAEPTDLATLCGQLQQEYKVEPDKCMGDVSAFVQKLRTEGLLE